MEDRLIPINALLGLLLPNDINTPVLALAGFHLVGLEIPVTVTPGESVVIDAVLLHSVTNHLVVVESKSGPNVKPDQATKYGRLSPQTVVQAGYVSLRTRATPTVETLYICLTEHKDRIRLGLATLGLIYPILAVSDTAAALDLAGTASAQLRAAFPEGGIALAGPPPRLIHFDQDSDASILRPRVLTELVAAMANRTPQISFANLSERATPHYPLYGRAAQGKIRRTVAQVVAALVAEMPDTFDSVPTISNRDGFVRILRTPEDNDARGRTQAYQALARPGRGRRRAAQASNPDQLDLLSELDSAENEAEELADDLVKDDPGEVEQ